MLKKNGQGAGRPEFGVWLCHLLVVFPSAHHLDFLSWFLFLRNAKTGVSMNAEPLSNSSISVSRQLKPSIPILEACGRASYVSRDSVLHGAFLACVFPLGLISKSLWSVESGDSEAQLSMCSWLTLSAHAFG